jgi:hypothetical protein
VSVDAEAEDPFEDDEYGDEREPQWWSVSSILSPETLALAGLTLAVVSLLGVTAGGSIASALRFHGNSFRTEAVIPGVNAGVAALATVMGLFAARDLWDEESSWADAVSRAAVVIGLVSVLANVVAFGFAISQSPEPTAIFGS